MNQSQNKRPIIGVIGGGFVGRAVARGFIEHAEEVRVFDTDPNRATHGLRETWRSDFVFVCVPTPAVPKSGRPNCSAVTAAISAYCEILKESPDAPRPVIVIRSTVRPGFTAYMQRLLVGVVAQSSREPAGVVHSPEFLTARCALVDFQTPARNIIGAVPLHDFEDGDGTGGWCGREADEASARAAIRLEELYKKRFPGVPVQMMTSTESELTKLAMNSFFAVKVDFFNTLKVICDAANADFERVRAGMLSDGRIAHAHTQAPGHDLLPGFGGGCLPKDLLNLFTFAQKMAVRADVLRGAHEHNLHMRGQFDESLPRPELTSPLLTLQETAALMRYRDRHDQAEPGNS